ncbi:Eukaryotic translation initiation factor 6 [Nosema bombycis CQ1]|uniref:Eukaryotic translation initiation factor 6 n=1 Tax=Nosema bombycis (strain CQ1 / CVCC 102059) TaxID=578461 RepID=R0MP67_NOSB1|nr:Eukaryotic translation initiation factor 6 [Nosema bombycis CQ1]|eukprot:EOB14668.1 Eukaryotic translation initiation factor 6 [Nosema bombycis CQ1]
MSFRIDFHGSSEVGAYMSFANTYCLVGRSSSGNTLKFLLENVDMPIIETTINGISMVGSQVRGNKNGLILSSATTDQELMHIRNSLPDHIMVKRIDERLNALGNVVLCNDNVCIIHADLDRTTEENISQVLGVPVYRQNIGSEPLVGTFASLNNQGMLVHPGTSEESKKELSELLEVNVIAGTINSGSPCIGGGLVVNDWMAIAGLKTSNIEMTVVESVFELGDDIDIEAKKKSIIDHVVN